MGWRARWNVRQMLKLGRDSDEIADWLNEQIPKKVVVPATLKAHAEVGNEAPLFYGTLTNSIRLRAPIQRGRSRVKTWAGQVYTNKVHGLVMEVGRKKGARRPPPSPIHRWVSLKARRGEFNLNHPAISGRTRAQKVNSATFIVARAISEMGSPARAKKGLKFFAKGLAVGQAELDSRLERLSDEFWRKFNG